MKRNRRFYLLCALIALTVCFIFLHSVLDQEHSRAESDRVLALIRPLLELFVGKGNVTGHLVRKLAHFAEFGLLGLELALLFRRLAAVPLLLLLLTGLMDETIQIFSGRGPQIQDVWLDFAGACAGFALGMLLRLFRKKEQKR